MNQIEGDCACGRINVHAHFLPPVYTDALAKAGVDTLDGGIPFPAWNAETALQMMDRQGIATAMVSLSSPAGGFLPADQRASLIRDVNLAGATLVNESPERFGYFASLPLPDIAASLQEIAFAFDTLGADGVVLMTNVDGEYLGSPWLAPIFAELDRRRATIFLHPDNPACYRQLVLGRPGPLLEYPLDTTRTIVDLIYSGTLKANPHLKLIVSHGGAALPSLAARIAMFANMPFTKPRPAGEEEVFDTLKGLYYDVALATHPVSYACLRQIAPVSQILFGSDWPFNTEANVGTGIGQLSNEIGISDSDARAIARENALRILPRLMARP